MSKVRGFSTFSGNGINLPKTQQLRLREIDKKNGDLTINIESNLKREYLPWVVDVENHDVSGIPDDILTLAKELAQKGIVPKDYQIKKLEPFFAASIKNLFFTGPAGEVIELFDYTNV